MLGLKLCLSLWKSILLVKMIILIILKLKSFALYWDHNFWFEDIWNQTHIIVKKFCSATFSHFKPD